MEPEVRRYLFKVGYSFFAGLVWLLINVTAGLYFGLAIVHQRVSVGNILFYIWFLASIAGLLYFFYRYWKL